MTQKTRKIIDAFNDTPCNVTTFVAEAGANFRVFRPAEEPRKINKPDEVIPAAYVHYRLATLHFQGLDAFIITRDGEVIDETAPPRVLPPVLGDVPDADVLDLGSKRTSIPAPLADMPDADVLG